ncbi:MAG: MFS transporter, partial [Betaproteobacteria bacterium]
MTPDSKISDNPWPPTSLAWSAVIILSVAQFFNAIDRYLINLLVEPIKADLGASDTEMGLLLGFAFAIFYTFMGLPIGRFADRASRKLIITAGVIFWSVMTIACGFAQSFKQLFVARMAVGAGEATLNPCSYSMISDYFPSEARAIPMGVFIMGATLGSAVVMYLGGYFIEYLTVNDIRWLMPWGQELKPWQIAFVCAGLPGVVVALVVQLLREPVRRELMVEDVASSGEVSLGQVFHFALGRKRVYLPMFLGFGLVLMWSMGKSLWAPTFFMRTFEWSPSEAGGVMALLMLGGNSLGVVSGGWFSQLLADRGYADAHLRTAFYGMVCGLPFAILAPWIADPIWSPILFAPAFFFGAFPFALAPAAISAITPN